MECYERASEITELLLGVEVSDSTIYRLTDNAGESLSKVIDEPYPKAVQILDFYHAMEHIGQYVKVALKSKLDIDKIMKKLGQILKTKGIRPVVRYLKNIPLRTTKQKQEYEKLLTYISNNEIRMNYPEYLKSIHGLKNMIKLRTASMSGYWNEVQKTIRAA